MSAVATPTQAFSVGQRVQIVRGMFTNEYAEVKGRCGGFYRVRTEREGLPLDYRPDEIKPADQGAQG